MPSDGVVAQGRSTEQVLLIPYLSLYLAKGPNRTDDLIARATTPLGRGDAKMRGVDPTFAHHVTQPSRFTARRCATSPTGFPGASLAAPPHPTVGIIARHATRAD